jgi:uncharacterized protein with PIN domain
MMENESGEYSSDYCCPKCNQKLNKAIRVIDSPTVIRDSSPCDAALLKECPKCFTKFWHHIIKHIFHLTPYVYKITNPQEFQLSEEEARQFEKE